MDLADFPNLDPSGGTCDVGGGGVVDLTDLASSQDSSVEVAVEEEAVPSLSSDVSPSVAEPSDDLPNPNDVDDADDDDDSLTLSAILAQSLSRRTPPTPEAFQSFLGCRLKEGAKFFTIHRSPSVRATPGQPHVALRDNKRVENEQESSSKKRRASWFPNVKPDGIQGSKEDRRKKCRVDAATGDKPNDEQKKGDSVDDADSTPSQPGQEGGQAKMKTTPGTISSTPSNQQRDTVKATGPGSSVVQGPPKARLTESIFKKNSSTHHAGKLQGLRRASSTGTVPVQKNTTAKRPALEKVSPSIPTDNGIRHQASPKGTSASASSRPSVLTLKGDHQPDCNSTTSSTARRRPGVPRGHATNKYPIAEEKGAQQGPQTISVGTVKSGSLTGYLGPERRPKERPVYTEPSDDKWKRITSLSRPEGLKEIQCGMREERLANLPAARDGKIRHAGQKACHRSDPSQAEVPLPKAQEACPPVKPQKISLLQQAATAGNDHLRQQAEAGLPRAQEPRPQMQRPPKQRPTVLRPPVRPPKTSSRQADVASDHTRPTPRASPAPPRQDGQPLRELANQPQTRELTELGRQRLQRLEDAHLAGQDSLVQPKAAQNNLNVSSVPKRASQRPSRITGDEIANAAKDMRILQKQYAEKKTTALTDALPPEFRRSQPSHKSRAKAVQNIASRERVEAITQERVIAKRMRAIRTEVEREFRESSKTHDFKEHLIREKCDRYMEKKKSQMLKKAQSQNRGLPPVDFLEDGQDGEAAAAAAAGSTQRGVPASQALEPGQAIVTYCVYLSQPIDEGVAYEDTMMRARAFGKSDSANYYAKLLLDDMSAPPRQHSRNQARRTMSLQTWYANGLLFGMKKRGDGKYVYVQVRKEKTLVGDMDPDVLRNQWVDEDVLDIYRKRYDVFEFQFIPRSVIEAEKRDEEARKLWDQRQEDKSVAPDGNRESTAQTEAMDGAEKENEPRGLEGDELRSALRALPACGPAPRQAKTHPEEGEDEHDDLFSSYVSSDADADSHIDLQEYDTAGSESLNNNNDKRPMESQNDKTSRGPTPFSAGTDDDPRNPYASCKLVTKIYGSFTDLHTANQRALAVARIAWKPTGCDLNALDHWKENMLPSLAEQMKELDLDSECAEIECPPKPFHGPNSRRAWPFVHARVCVVEIEIEGPMDTEIDFAMDMTEAHTSRGVQTILSKATAAAGKTGEAQVVDSDNEEDIDDGLTLPLTDNNVDVSEEE
ncbi:hypothetical protein M406DRAFT_66536 [Cryphonectria parasitica EP155]|uniref:Uncharacterized protein n=1 Tax=Cryphonectria parasitica (strain ATCC 38755 / EP155) TaxID=660469 RepID=A0A9P4YBN8_CRYP1|nr:uncharacterized protein M406DRAFT_66536 [Cryphonectria parasitica EP155]KAF3770096.1 hypothetical protein M406DRAFT_66536 [Cryphonectria parasitica EP155]